jgi:hypothetical protein
MRGLLHLKDVSGTGDKTDETKSDGLESLGEHGDGLTGSTG